MQLHEKNSVTPTETQHLFTSTSIKTTDGLLIKAMYLKGFVLIMFCSSLLLQREIVESMWELLGILGLFQLAERSYPSSPHSKPFLLLLF